VWCILLPVAALNLTISSAGTRLRSFRSRPLSEIDQQLIGALDASQADAGLGAHVTACAGEPCHG
jgi:hypothetical protein